MEKEDRLIPLIKKCKDMINENYINSINSQLTDLVYKDLVYRCFNEGLRLDKGNEANRPLVIIDNYHEYFFQNQVIRIRRLLDAKEDAISLRRIFDIVYNNRHLFTRKGYIAANQSQIDKLNTAEMKRMQIDYLNSLYDKISIFDGHARRDNDKLNFDYLEKIKQYLLKRNLIHNYTNAFVAHSLRRKNFPEEELENVSLKEMQRDYQKIAWLSSTLSFYIGEFILFEVPVVPFDQFQGWCGSIYKKNIERSLYRYWDRRSMMFERWKQKYWLAGDFYLNPTRRVQKD